MRFGVLSDVHGNLHALRAAVDVLSGERVDGYLCLGDIVGYGPQPNECVALIAELGADCVVGNHELMALRAMDVGRASAYAEEAIRWTRSELTPGSIAFVQDLPRTREVAGMRLAHGSLQDPYEYVLSEERAREQLSELSGTSASTLLLGHTHDAWAFSERRGTLLSRAAGEVAREADERFLLNPGSVGQSRDDVPECRFLLIDDDAQRVEFFSVAYDVEGCRAELRRRGRPLDAIHRRPGRRRNGVVARLKEKASRIRR